jgi:ATP-dependent Clp protease ATP-binding subunit ClpC
MAYLLSALAGFAVAFLVVRAWPQLRAGLGAASSASDPVQSSEPAVPPDGASEVRPEGPQAPSAPLSLSARLHELAQTVEPFAKRTAHPRELSEHPGFRELTQTLAAPEVSLDTLRQYALGDHWLLSCAALAALRGRADRAALSVALTREFQHLRPWPIYFALEYFASLDPRPPAGAAAASARDWWSENPAIAPIFSEHFARREALGDRATFAGALASPGVDLAAVEALLRRIEHPFARVLLDEIADFRLQTVDESFLRSFGRLWTSEEAESLLIEPAPWRSALETAAQAIKRNPRRSVLVSGDAGVGKSSFVRLLGAALMKDGWTVFQAGAAELMAGQSFIGELEGRIQRLIKEVSGPRRIVWYVPDLLAVAASGAHRTQNATILDQILPAVSAGRIVLLAEGSPAGATRVLQARPALRSVFELVLLSPATDAEASVLGERFATLLAADLALTVDPACTAAALRLIHQYMNYAHLPGTLFDLLKLSAQRCIDAGETTLTPRTLLATLSQVTGLPQALLDGSERLDLSGVRSFFERRVMGQEEAVAAIVDRIAMLKAGLTDPGRPLGVFLFAGPTGTGKTELAKSLAEYLFGSADRMIRLDMSEFQTPDALRKIMGEAGEGADAHALIQRVRKQPFSVVLLDEFEKSHGNVWDLFLQVFDDGRLSDANGSTADFRQCIIILTSNLGATSHQGRALGFLPDASRFAPEQILRSVHQTFRPEFINRLDRVLVFRPLSRELMRGILRKELRNVLQRRGLRDREWAVEWESSAQEFLLDKGFSAELGARPLRRAIDDYVLAPLAAVMVEHRAPQGDQFLFVRSDGRGIQVEFVDPEDEALSAASEEAPAPGERLTLAAMVLQPGGVAAERQALEAACVALEARLAAPEWDAVHRQLLEAMAAPAFWLRDDRQRVLARFALIDRVRAAASTARSLRERLQKSADRSGRVSRELVARLALQVRVVNDGIDDVLADAPIELALIVEPAMEAGESIAARDWRARLLEMYRSWARKRRMQLQPIGAERGVLVVSGFGAYRTLNAEAGLHVFESDAPIEGTARVTCRVRVIPVPVETDLTASPASLAELLARAPSVASVVRRYRREPSPLVRDARHGWRSGRIDAILGGDFDLLGQP